MKKYINLVVALSAWIALMVVFQIQGNHLLQDLPHAHPFLFGAFSGGSFVLVIALFSPRRHCSRYDAELPRFRMPTSFGQAAWGGWDCPTCHAHLDRNGFIKRNG
jgi:hypothetical protein